jgi:diguanylate cyclase (GGDEF)-like protein
MVSRTAGVSVRPFDQVCRWGGDEFVALIAHVDRPRLAIVAEKIRALVEASCLDAGGDALHVTISLGASVARAADTPETLLGRADRLMYASKAAGGNRITLPPGGE